MAAEMREEIAAPRRRGQDARPDHRVLRGEVRQPGSAGRADRQRLQPPGVAAAVRRRASSASSSSAAWRCAGRARAHRRTPRPATAGAGQSATSSSSSTMSSETSTDAARVDAPRGPRFQPLARSTSLAVDARARPPRSCVARDTHPVALLLLSARRRSAPASSAMALHRALLGFFGRRHRDTAPPTSRAARGARAGEGARAAIDQGARVRSRDGEGQRRRLHGDQRPAARARADADAGPRARARHAPTRRRGRRRNQRSRRAGRARRCRELRRHRQRRGRAVLQAVRSEAGVDDSRRSCGRWALALLLACGVAPASRRRTRRCRTRKRCRAVPLPATDLPVGHRLGARDSRHLRRTTSPGSHGRVHRRRPEAHGRRPTRTAARRSPACRRGARVRAVDRRGRRAARVAGDRRSARRASASCSSRPIPERRARRRGSAARRRRRRDTGTVVLRAGVARHRGDLATSGSTSSTSLADPQHGARRRWTSAARSSSTCRARRAARRCCEGSSPAGDGATARASSVTGPFAPGTTLRPGRRTSCRTAAARRASSSSGRRRCSRSTVLVAADRRPRRRVAAARRRSSEVDRAGPAADRRRPGPAIAGGADARSSTSPDCRTTRSGRATSRSRSPASSSRSASGPRSCAAPAPPVGMTRRDRASGVDFDRVEVRDVSRHYGRRRALSHVDADVATPGEIIGAASVRTAPASPRCSASSRRSCGRRAGDVRYGDAAGARDGRCAARRGSACSATICFSTAI